MPRIRTIKPDFFQHEELFDLEQRSGLPVRLAFAGLWCHADREGLFRWQPRRLKLGCLPYDDCDFSDVLDALESEGFVVRYEVDGKFYGAIPSWHEHQTIPSKEPSSKLPSKGEACNGTGHDPKRYRADPETLQVGREGKGKEGKGKDMSSSDKPTSTVRDDVDQVVEHYQTFHPRSKPGLAERNRIRDRLKEGYTVEELKQAIDGNHADPFCSGQNDRGTKYHGIGLIFRDSDHVTKYLVAAEKPRRTVRARDPTLERSMAITGFVESARRLEMDSDWIEEHIHEPDRAGKSLDEIKAGCRAALQAERQTAGGVP